MADWHRVTSTGTVTRGAPRGPSRQPQRRVAFPPSTMTTVSDPPPAVADLGTRSGARSWWGWAALIVVLPGIALRVFQYAALPSIWVDEAAIARNVLDRDAADLLRPLDYGQVAPPGFLLGVKLSTEILGISEYGLRLVPLLAGIASIVLFCRIARTMLRPVASIVATLMFSAAAPLIYFSSNLKQYSSDVAATLVVVAVAQRLGVSRLTPRTAVGFALLAAVLLFFSEAVIFPLTVAGAVLCADAVFSTTLCVCLPRAPGKLAKQRPGEMAHTLHAACGCPSLRRQKSKRPAAKR